MATASLVLGIVGIPLCFLFLPSILAVIFGIIGLSQIKSNPGQSGRGKAIAGLFLGGISLVFIIGLVVFIGTWDFDFETQTILF